MTPRKQMEVETNRISSDLIKIVFDTNRDKPDTSTQTDTNDINKI